MNTMKFGEFEISCHNFGNFALDGGAMFGSVPKNIWSRHIAADDKNRIPLATNCLLIRYRKQLILVDVGLGEKWNDKERSIYAINNKPESEWGFNPNEVTDIILTHLHFDHAGGISYFDESGKVCPKFPKARVWLQEENLENAKSPGLKEKASYLPENINVLKEYRLELVRGSQEIFSNIWVHQANGHTEGQQWIEIRDGSKSIAYTTDLIPTSHHLPLPFTMGYDMCAKTILDEKKALLDKALKDDWIIAFEHDVALEAARICLSDKGHFAVKERLSFA